MDLQEGSIVAVINKLPNCSTMSPMGGALQFLISTMTPEYRIAFDNLDWVCPGDDIRYKCYQHDGVQIRLVEFGKSMEHPNWCFSGHYGYVLDGKMELTFANSKQTYGPGDAIFIPDGIDHKHRPKSLTRKVTFFSVELVHPEKSDRNDILQDGDY